MGVPEFFADQLRNPSGVFGRVVMSRFFDRSSRAINQLTMRSLALAPTDRVLEVGFGAGDLIAHMAPVVREGSVAGVDVSPDMVAVGARRLAALVESGRVELRCASVGSPPLRRRALHQGLHGEHGLLLARAGGRARRSSGASCAPAARW